MNRTGATRSLNAVEPQPGVSAIKPFRRLWLGSSLSSLGHWLSVPALAALAGTVTADDGLPAQARAIAGVLALMALPAVLLGPVAARLAGRADRRLVMIVADALRFALVASVPLVGALPWTLAAAFLVGCAAVLWTPAVSAAVPELVPEDGAAQARRSVLRGAYGAAPVAAVLFAVLALIAGGAFDGADRADLPLYVTAVVFLAAAGVTFTAGELSARAAATAPSPLKLIFRGRGGHGGDTPVAGAQAAGPVRGLGLAGVVAALTGASVVAVARPYANDLGGGDPGFGSVLAGLTVGTALGLFLGPRMLLPLSRRRVAGLATIVAALALIPAALVQNLVVVVFLTAFLGVAAGVAWAVGVRLPDPEDGSFGFLHAVALVTGLIAVAAVPPLAGLIGDHRLSLGGAAYTIGGPGVALLIVAVLSVIASLVAYRRLDDRRGIPLAADVRAALAGHTYTPPEQAESGGPAVVRDRGVFIAFEGGEGAGKTTQARLAAIWLRDHGYDVIATHEPGATKIGMRLRAMLLDRETIGLSSRAETLLYAADRADHVANVIRPALERGSIVVSDRYVDSSLAYQGFGREQDVSEIARVNAWAIGGLLPDLTVLLEVPPETGLGRLASPADRIESEPAEFHDRVRLGFRALAEADPDRYLILDARRPQAEITREIQYRIREILPDPIPAGTEDVTSTFPAITDA
ncbi:dTMP kinase [Spirillospora sp. NPDC029432]|uniref:dTMP kinase n=1 Tax=Spirillospora sp. NPDC029432 TaxID=3154599 RepID=UPI0034543D27